MIINVVNIIKIVVIQSLENNNSELSVIKDDIRNIKEKVGV